MKIVKCQNCGIYLPILSDDERCYCCGGNNLMAVETKRPHFNAISWIETSERHIKAGHYEDSMKCANMAIRWDPTLPDIYWLRTLASHKCKTAYDLIIKGVNPLEDPNFANALLFEQDGSITPYHEIQRRVDSIEQELEQSLKKHLHNEFERIRIQESAASFSERLTQSHSSITELLNELQSIESDMLCLEKKADFICSEYRNDLEQATKEADSIRDTLYKSESIGATKVRSYRTAFNTIQTVSSNALNEIMTMQKDHPLVSEFSALTEKRDSVSKKIDKAYDVLSEWERDARQYLDKANKIKATHANAIEMTKSYEFSTAVSILGSEESRTAIRQAGIAAY